MIIVPIKENESIDKALKKFKKKIERTGMVRELRRRQTFEKPSVERRQEIIHAKYRDMMQRTSILWSAIIRYNIFLFDSGLLHRCFSEEI